MTFKTWGEIYDNAYNYETECANLGYKSRRIPPDDKCQWDNIVQDIVYRIMLDCNIDEVQARIVVGFIDAAYNIDDLTTFTNTARIFTDRLIKPLMSDGGLEDRTNGHME